MCSRSILAVSMPAVSVSKAGLRPVPGRRPLQFVQCRSAGGASKKSVGLATTLQQHWRVQPASDVPTPGWGLALPIIPSSTFKLADAGHGARLHAKGRSPEADKDGYVYGRWGNPTTHALGRIISTAEGIDVEADGSGTYVFASGMAAISTVFLSFLQSGSHVVAQRCVYGATYEILSSILPAMGVEVTLVDGPSLEEWRAAIRPTTRMLYAETPANPSMRLSDMQALGALSLEVGAGRAAEERPVVAVDGTFGTPYHQSPLEYPGVDISIHSCTKYLGGHSDVLAGSVTAKKNPAILSRVGHMQKLLGNALGPWESYLVARGMKTFVPRMRTHSGNALEVARYLESHPKIQVVHYPGLESHPDHELAKQQMKHGFGGMLSFEVQDYEAAAKVCGGVRRIHLAVSLGATESLVQHPASMTHAMVPESERQAAGIPGGLIRLSVGIEDPQDLIADLDQALAF